ncbi:MAG: hypothetical protein KGP29_00355 [Proteobacteria bacterium]|nr:hypothetical protein [Pseudomonadota bacterium]
MSKKPFTEQFPSKNPSQTNAPIVFLVGTSTAGKSTICDKILLQDAGAHTCKIWGNDSQFDRNLNACRELLSGNQKFEEVKQYLGETLNEFDVFVPMIGGSFIGRSKDGNQTLHLLREGDLAPLEEEEFERNLADFMEKTEGRYDPKALRIIRELAQENPRDFREVASFGGLSLNDQIVEEAIRNSQQGVATILDVIPPIESFTDRLREMGHECPVHIALIHVPLDKLTKRMEKRNEDAMSEGGNPNNRRDGLFPHDQYGQLFGASDDGEQVGRLSAKSIHEAVEKFGEENGVKIRDMKSDSSLEEEKHKSAMAPIFSTLREGKKLRDHLGFEDGGTTLEVKTKVSADSVYENGEGEAAKIAGKIYDWISQKMEKTKEPSWKIILNRTSESKDDSTITR